MCHPAVAAAASVAQLGLSVAGTMSKQQSLADTSAQTTYNANTALGQSYNGVQLKQNQAADKATQQSFDVLKQMAVAKGKATVGAGEAGVGGISFSNVLADFEAKRAEAKGKTDYNYASEVQAGEDEKKALRSRAESVIAATPKPNAMTAMAEVGGAGVNAGLKIYDIGDKAGWWKG